MEIKCKESSNKVEIIQIRWFFAKILKFVCFCRGRQWHGAVCGAGTGARDALGMLAAMERSGRRVDSGQTLPYHFAPQIFTIGGTGMNDISLESWEYFQFNNTLRFIVARLMSEWPAGESEPDLASEAPAAVYDDRPWLNFPAVASLILRVQH